MIEHPALKQAIQRVDEARHLRRSFHGSTSNLAFLAPPGHGKSVFIQQYLQRNPPVVEDSRTHRPVAALEIDHGTRGAFLTNLLRSIGEDPDRVGHRLKDKKDAFLTQAKGIGLEVLMIDEVQLLVDEKRVKLSRDVVDDISAIINNSDFVVVLVGRTNLEHAFRSHSYFQRRFDEPIYFRPFCWERSQVHFRKFLDRVDEKLPFDSISGLADKELAYDIYQASSGVIAVFMKVISRAAFIACSEGAEKISQNHLRDAFELCVGLRHPFRKMKDLYDYNPFAAEDRGFAKLITPGALAED